MRILIDTINYMIIHKTKVNEIEQQKLKTKQKFKINSGKINHIMITCKHIRTNSVNIVHVNIIM